MGLSQTVQNCFSLTGSCTFCTHTLSKPGIRYLHSFSRSHFTFSTVLQTSGHPFFKYVFCLIWLLKVLVPLLMLMVFLKHRDYCQRVPSYVLFIPFESSYPNAWFIMAFILVRSALGVSASVRFGRFSICMWQELNSMPLPSKQLPDF